MTVTYEEEITRTGWNGAQKFYLAVAMVIALTDGFDTQLLGISLPSIMADWGVGRPEMANVIAASTLGSIVGAFTTGMLSARFGVKRTLLLMIVLNALGNFASCLSEGLPTLIGARFVCGIGLGGILAAIAALVGEITPPARRTFALALCGLCMPLGGLIAGVSAEHIMAASDWRGLFLAGGIVPIASLPLALFALPESPFFLAQRPAKSDVLRRTLVRLGVSPDISFAAAKADAPKSGFDLSSLFDRGWRRDTLALWCGYFGCILAVFSMLSWLSAFFVQQGHSPADGARGLAAASAGALFGSLASAILLRVAGSRLILTLFPAAAAILAMVLAQLFVLKVSLTYILACIASLSFCFSIVQTSFYAVIGNTYDAPRRLAGNSAAYGMGRIGALASAFVGAMAMGAGAVGYFGLLSALQLVIFVAMIAFTRHAIPSRASDSSNTSPQPVRAH